MEDSLKILEAVNSFYSQSFGQLMNITVAVLAFSGIVLPILITLYQKRLFKLEHLAIENKLLYEMEEKIKKATDVIKSEYEKKEMDFDNKISKMKMLFENELESIKGGVLHVQGNNELKQSDELTAFESFVSASFCYVKSEDNLNLRRVLDLINNSCLRKFNVDSFEEHGDTFKSFDELLEAVRDYDKKGVFSDLIRETNQAYSLAKKRQPALKAQSNPTS